MLDSRSQVAQFLARVAPRTLDPTGRRLAAVACVLAPTDSGELGFLLTRRSNGLRSHGGQFALPGGRLDPGEGVEEAARRELWEELGVDLEADKVLGHLDDFGTRSGYLITPVVLWSETMPRVVPAPDEVAQVFRVSFSELDHPAMPTLRRIPQSTRPVLSVPLRGNFVHAPTAAVIYQLWEMIWNGRRVDVAHYEQPLFAWR